MADLTDMDTTDNELSPSSCTTRSVLLLCSSLESSENDNIYENSENESSISILKGNSNSVDKIVNTIALSKGNNSSIEVSILNSSHGPEASDSELPGWASLPVYFVSSGD